MEYIESLAEPGEGCFLCAYRDNGEDDARNLVLWRGRRALAVLNRFPYTGGHTLVAPLEHVGGLDDLDGETMVEMMEMVRDVQVALRHTIGAEGFNIGFNVGHCAGAGLPDHIHVHVVPRWHGDTNFMSVFGGVRVISQALETLREQLLATAAKLGLPKLSSPRRK
jgi:ATP adenylyltransferase